MKEWGERLMMHVRSVHDRSVEAAALRACASLDMVCWSREGLELLPWDRKRWSLQQNIVLRLVKKLSNLEQS